MLILDFNVSYVTDLCLFYACVILVLTL